MIFSGDQGRDVTAVARMIETGQPALLGPGSGAGQFKRGPAYYYLLLPALWLAGGEPLSGALFIALVDVAATAMLFVVGRALVSSTAGLVAAMLYACAYVPIEIARAFSNPALLPFLTLVMLYALWRTVQGQDRFLLVLVGAWLVAWQLHDQVVLLLPWFGAVWILFRPRVRANTILLAIALGIVLLAPFIWDETMTGAANGRAMIEYVRAALTTRSSELGIGGAPTRVGETLWLAANALISTIGIRILWSVSVIASGIALAARARRETRGAQFLLFYTFTPFLFFFWPGPIYPLNIAIVIAAPFLLVGYGFERLTRAAPRGRTAGLAAIALLALLNAAILFAGTRAYPLQTDSYATVRAVVESIRAASAGQPFVFEYIVETRNEEFASPFTYLLKRAPVTLTDDDAAMRFRVYNPAALSGTEHGALLNDIQIVPYAPPQPVGENLLNKPWDLRAPDSNDARLASNANEIIFETRAPQETSAVQKFSLEPNAVYLARFECRNELANGDQRVYVQVMNAHGERLKTFPNGGGFECPSQPEWTRGAILIETPFDAARGVMWLRARGQGTVWFRNAQLQRAEFNILK